MRPRAAAHASAPILAVLGAGCLLAACGTPAGARSTSSPSPPPTTTPVPAPSPTPESGAQWVAGNCTSSGGSLVFADQEHGWLAETTGATTSAVLATDDGGSSWIRQLSLPYPLSQLDFVSASDGWALGDMPAAKSTETQGFLRTTGGGASWVPANLPRAPLACIDLASASVGFGVTESGRLVRTSDGGSSWSAVSVAGGLTIDALCFDSAAQGWMLAGASRRGTLGIYRTERGGADWTLQVSSSWIDELSLPSMSCRGATVWVGPAALGPGAGNHPTEYVRTTDAGAQWTPPPSPAPSGLEFDDLDGPFEVVDATTVELSGYAFGAGPMFSEWVDGQTLTSPSLRLPATLVQPGTSVVAMSFINHSQGWLLLSCAFLGCGPAAATSDHRGPTGVHLDTELPTGGGAARLTGGGGSHTDFVYSTSDGGRTWRQILHFSYTLPTPAP